MSSEFKCRGFNAPLPVLKNKIESFLVQMNGKTTRQELASAVGMDQKVVNAAISEMAKLGKVTVSGNIVTLKKPK